MSKTRLELKVGLFVAVGIVLLAVMMIQFSKGKSLFRQTYEISVSAPTVGGLQKGASVLLAGVAVGNVRDIDLGPQGTNVLIRLEILKRYVIYSDAEFVIEQSGFLGDQYMAIVPKENAAPLLEDGDEVRCRAPFDIQAVARDAAGFLQRIDQTARELGEAIEELREKFLNDQTLSNLADSATELRETSTEAKLTMQNVNSVVLSNREPVETAVSNLVRFSEGLNVFSASANALIETNTPVINDAFRDIRDSAESLKKLLRKSESGDNLAAALLSDEELANEVSQIAHNLSITTSNLNQRGLWGIMWKHKQPKPKRESDTVEPLRSPRDPFR